MDGGYGAPAHARKHKNEFEDLVGRRPESYDEVRRLLGSVEVDDESGEIEIPGQHRLTAFRTEE